MMSDSIRDEVLAAATIAGVLRIANVDPPTNERKNIRCPLHDDSTPSFTVQASGKGWKCHAGCGAGGVFDLVVALRLAPTASAAINLLADHYGIARNGASGSYKAAKKRKPLPQFELKVVEPLPTLTSEDKASLTKAVRGCRPILGTPGAAYLKGRGFAPDAADTCEVRYHPNWLGGGEAVVFPCRTSDGKLVAAQGRYLSHMALPKTRSKGKVSLGAFSTPGALSVDSRLIAIAEAPIDALSIYEASGTPAIALFGTAVPSWLRRCTSFKHVLIATDSDAAGNTCASRLMAELTLCISVRRIQWPDGIKDANEFLVRDGEGLRSTFDVYRRYK